MKGFRSRNEKSGRTGTVRIRKGSRVYRIPVENGYVPEWALAQRFQEVGSTEDLDHDSKIVLPANCTPEELIDWWIDPSSCDICGVDTRDSQMYDVSGVPDGKKHAQRRIAVIADPEEAQRIRQILSESFTREELETMASNGSIVIRTVPDCGDATGCYFRRQDGVEVPLIVLERGTTPDGVVHEMVHHLRAVDPSRKGVLRTAFPSDKTGRLDSGILRRLSKRQRDDIVEQEERATVAETVARTGIDPYQSGYYDGVPGVDPRTAYVQDKYIVTGRTPEDTPPYQLPKLKGKAARNAVANGYEYMNVARSRILDRNVKKRRRPSSELDRNPGDAWENASKKEVRECHQTLSIGKASTT